MESDLVYWIWLQCALGVSPSLRTQEIIAGFSGGAKEIFASSDYDRRISGVFTGTQLDRLRKTQLSQAEHLLEVCASQNLHILSPQEAGYPARLRQIVNHPLALYVRGSLDFLQDQLGISIVGTRSASRKSVDIAARLSADLVRAGCAIVSGGALGVDSAAHWGTLHAGGCTCAVLGCGLDSSYLQENAGLRAKIAQSGAVVSEFPPGTEPAGRNFPIRNRIISGMTVGTVVIEAGERSGSLITATCAAEQGRDVFAVPGDAFGSTYNGGNRLIREGAKPVFSAIDILEEYETLYPELLNMRNASRNLERPAVDPDTVTVKQKKQTAAPPPAAIEPPAPEPVAPPTDLPDLERQIMHIMQRGAQHIDRIMKETGASFGTLFSALTELEIRGLIEQSPGKQYSIKH